LDSRWCCCLDPMPHSGVARGEHFVALSDAVYIVSR